MRLIKADNLKVLVAIENGEEPITSGKLVTELFDKMKTVEAIPIEWLRERASRMLDFGEGIERIIQEWQDEQSK